jgi:hypothetical protein
MRIELNLRSLEIPQLTSPVRSNSRFDSAPANNPDLAGSAAKPSLDLRRIEALAFEVRELPEIRDEKVAALGRALRSGSYKIKAAETAEALLSQMRMRRAA